MKIIKKILVYTLVFILFGVILMGIMIGPNIKRDKVLYLNNSARNIYNELTKCIVSIDDEYKIDGENTYFFGEINENNDIILYNAKKNEMSTLVSFSNISCPNSYWAICIKNGMIGRIQGSPGRKLAAVPDHPGFPGRHLCNASEGCKHLLQLYTHPAGRVPDHGFGSQCGAQLLGRTQLSYGYNA